MLNVDLWRLFATGSGDREGFSVKITRLAYNAEHPSVLPYEFWVGLRADKIWTKRYESSGRGSAMAVRGNGTPPWARRHIFYTVSMAHD